MLKFNTWPNPDGFSRAPAAAARNTSAAASLMTRKPSGGAYATTTAAAAARAVSLHDHLGLCDDCYDEMAAASNAVLDLVDAGKLDEAEQAAHDLLERFPGVHDGYARLGLVCEVRGDKAKSTARALYRCRRIARLQLGRSATVTSPGQNALKSRTCFRSSAMLSSPYERTRKRRPAAGCFVTPAAQNPSATPPQAGARQATVA